MDIAIIGVGLIGGSFGLAIKKSQPKEKISIIGIGRDIKKLKLAKEIGAIDSYTIDFTEGVKSADLVLISTPVDTIVDIFSKILPYLKPGTVVTDTGSIKKRIITDITKVLKTQSDNSNSNIYFVGSHPLAGSEKSGVRYASAHLFNNATVVVTPYKENLKIKLSKNNHNLYHKINANKIVCELWESVGAEVIFMSPEEHDRLVALTSHLPHIISASLVLQVHKANKINKNVKKLLAGSFYDLTRITDSLPSLWSGICNLNREEISRSLTEFCLLLKQIKIELDSKEKLLKFFSYAKDKRIELLRKK